MNACTEALNGIAKNIERLGRGYSFKAIRAKMLYSKGLQKQIRPVRYGGDFVGKMVGCPVDGPRPILGTDVDALLRVLEQERPTDGESTS